MSAQQGRAQGERPVSAKELAEMGFCEKRVLLSHVHGQRLTPEQERGAKQGRLAHDRYHREGLAAASAAGDDQRCFVATCLFGDDAWQVFALRCYRDDVLHRRQVGRWIVAVYYRVSPVACTVLTRLPWLQRPARVLVGALARAARRHAEVYR